MLSKLYFKKPSLVAGWIGGSRTTSEKKFQLTREEEKRRACN